MPRITDKGVVAALSQKLSDLPADALASLAIDLSTDMPDGGREPHAWLGTGSSFREWVGRRLSRNPHAFDFAIVNKKYENSGDLPKAIVIADKTDEAMLWIEDFAASFPLWKAELLAALINTGETALAFDGQAYFDTDHSYADSGTFSNDLSYSVSSASAVTAEEAALAINTAIETMRGFPDDHGRRIANRGMRAVAVVCQSGTANAAAIRQAITSDRLDTGAGTIDNPLRGQDVAIRLISDGLVTLGATKFALIRDRANDARARPLAFQENRQMRELTVLTDANAPAYTTEHDAWGIRAKAVGAAGYGRFDQACLTTFS